jgi:tRNA U34 5-methylaminomethyl-2-thiouridine-forming methyltransferase MnmC
VFVKTNEKRETKNNFYKSFILNQIIKTADGSHTIYVPELDEHYHSIYGAIQESEYIFIRNGLDFCKSDPVKIFEVGFGTGLNALLTALRCAEGNRQVFYTSVEKYPLEDSVLKSLNYPCLTGDDGMRIFESIHSSGWESIHNISPNFNIAKIRGDMASLYPDGVYDLIYFDAFGPDKQPEMWTQEIFMKISNITRSGGIFVTYSVKGEVKRNLRSAGFDIKLLPGPPGKRHILRAIKI